MTDHARTLFLIGLTAVIGCGGGDVTEVPTGIIVEGRIIEDGRPLTILKADNGQDKLVLMEVFPSGQSHGVESAEIDDDGRFVIRGPGEGIPPGTYTMTVQHLPLGFGSEDTLGGKFGPERSPLEFSVPNEALGKTHDLGEIDLAKPETFPKK